MSWSPPQTPYSSSGTFMDFFESLTYEHVNFIFAGAQYPQESIYPSTYTNPYKAGQSEPGNMSYYDYGNSYVIGHHAAAHMENPSLIVDEQNTASHTPQEGNINSNSQATRVDCPQRQNTARDYQAVWQDNVDPDSMTYEELLELGEAVGTENRGLSQELISTLPISKFKCGFFSRKRSRNERCVICQMEYKRRERRITLPCKHAYHVSCGSKWLSINKACPICYKEVFADESKP